MLKLAICEDETFMLNDLEIKVNRYLKKAKTYGQVFCFTNGVQLIHSTYIFDIIIMDIKMSGLDGMETVHKLRSEGKNSQIIFVTSSKEHVFQAFDVDAVHYLLKPVSENDLFHAIDKAIKRLGQHDNKTINITKGCSIQVINIRDIIYCESVDHKIYIHTNDNIIDYYGKLNDLQKQLDSRFFRCHRSFIVNMNFVSSKQQEIAIMVNGQSILISRRKRQDFTQKLLSFIRSEVL